MHARPAAVSGGAAYLPGALFDHHQRHHLVHGGVVCFASALFPRPIRLVSNQRVCTAKDKRGVNTHSARRNNNNKPWRLALRDPCARGTADLVLLSEVPRTASGAAAPGFRPNANMDRLGVDRGGEDMMQKLTSELTFSELTTWLTALSLQLTKPGVVGEAELAAL